MKGIIIGIFGVGFIGGFAFAWFGGGEGGAFGGAAVVPVWPGSEPAAAPKEATSTSSADCDRRVATLRRVAQDLEAQLGKVTTASNVLAKDRIEREGAPSEWSESLSPLERQAALEAAFRAAIPKVPDVKSLYAMDCSEYPCVITLELEAGAGVIAVSPEEVHPVSDVLHWMPEYDQYLTGPLATHGAGTEEAPVGLVSFVIYTGEFEKNVRKRSNFRVQDIADRGVTEAP